MPSHVESVDTNLMTIRTIEGGWSLPPLPAEVSLDLASQQSLSSQQITELLGGVEADLQDANRRAPVPVRDALIPDRDYTRQEAGKTALSLIGAQKAHEYSPDAVQIFKQKAVDAGYLDLTDTQIEDSRWLPEYGVAAREMAIDERKSDFKGDRPGNLSLEKIGQVIEDWFSPRGLYKAAIALDLWWDKEAIGREFSSWGEKFEEYGKEPWNPLKLIDALTGPIDDLVMPIVNWGLMLTGIGEVYATGRVLYGGVRGAEAVAGMYKGAQGIKYAGKFAGVKNALIATDRAADVDKLRGASFLSGKIAPKPGASFLPGSREAVSGAMNAWRGNRNVAMARKANQQVMRLGIASNLQGTIDDETGGNIAKVSTIDEYVGQVLDNDAVDWAVDLLFMPTNFLEPGAIKAGLNAAGKGINTLSHSPGGRFGFQRVTENEKMTAAYLPAMRTWLEETKPGALKQFDKDISKFGAVQAMANQITSGNTETLGAAMAFTTVSAAVDAHARRMASLGEAAVQHLDETNLGQFFAHRNKAQAQLTRLDLDDVDRAFEMMALYGDESAIAVEQNLKRPRKWRNYRESLREAHMEDEASFVARAGAVPEGHVRLYGTRAYDDHDVIKWAKENPGDDPFFVDLSEAEAARVLAGDDPGLTSRYMKEVEGGTRQRFRLSEASQVRVYDQEKLKNVRAIMENHNNLRKGFVTELLNQTGPEVIEQYAYETLDTFGNWDNFQTMSHELRLAVARGDLDNVKFAPAMSENNRRIGLLPGQKDPRLGDELFRQYLELPNLVDPAISRSTFAPFARDVDAGQARFTMAKIGADGKTIQPLKQEAVAHAHLVEQSIKGIDNLAALRRHPQWSEIEEAVDLKRAAAMAADDVTLDMKSVVDEVIAELAIEGKSVERLRQLVRQANKRGVSLADVEDALRKHLVQEHANEIWSTRFGMGEDVMGRESADIVELMRARVKKLRAKSQFMASEVEGLPPGLAEGMDQKGWKPVYGVQFVQPEDLMDVLPEIADVTMAQVRQAKMQSFFGRQDPEYIRKLKTRVVNSSLHAALTTAKRKGEKIHLNVGVHGEDAGDMKKVIDDLWSILEDEQTVARDTLDSLRDARWVRKVTGRAKLSTTPMSVERLASELGFKDLSSRLQKMGYTHDESLAIYHGLQKSQAIGFKHLGLYEIEAKLRANPVLTDGLRLFGRHAAKENLGLGKRAEGWAIQTGGVIGGSVLTSGQYLKDNPDEETLSAGHLASIAAGMVVGKMAGTSLAKRRGLIGEASGKVSQMADAWDHSKWADWAYLGDKMANMRDTFRFSLSPIFDASRYSEAMILSQLEELPAGLKNLKVNQSPKGYRKILTKEFQAQGHDVHKARELADQEWTKVTQQFSAAAKGDFDWETIDSIGRRFSSVGILGFSPADWMASTFGHLTKAGASADDAYKTVRKMYTYGTTGRSAAEVSVNFVFFPFSFTKKTLGHMSSFVQQDVGRMIVIHDAARMYEKLSEHYNLEEVFRDRMPALQRLYRLNILAYGIGPGRFGGVNAGILEGARETPGVGLILGSAVPDTDVIMNLFMPQGVQVKDQAEAENIWRSLQDVLPLFNDIEQLYGDLQQQTRVITSDTHMTAAGEVQHGYEEWRAFQAEIMPVLEAQGMTWAQAMANEELGIMLRTKRVEIQKKYPAWSSSMAQSASHPAALQMEKTQRILSPENDADLKLAQFDSTMDTVSDVLRQGGASWSNPEDIPPEVFDMMRGLAISMAKENPEFRRLYYRFYSHILGDITTEVQT